MGRISWHGSKAKDAAKSPLAEHIGQQLLTQRQKRQVTLRQLSAETGLSQAFLCDLENGKQCPGAETLWILTAYFGVPFGYWVKGLDQ